jgi:hypothetical protein
MSEVIKYVEIIGTAALAILSLVLAFALLA